MEQIKTAKKNICDKQASSSPKNTFLYIFGICATFLLSACTHIEEFVQQTQLNQIFNANEANQVITKPKQTKAPSALTPKAEAQSVFLEDTFNTVQPKKMTTTLSNGLKVIIQEDHRSAVVMTQIWYKVGSTDEQQGLGGISHLLEHMMFKGTKKVSGDDFSRIVSRFGGAQNAFTSFDYTGYYQNYPAHRLGLALELEADRMRNLVLTESDFISERQVVMEERRQRTDDVPRALAYEQFRYKAFTKGNQRNPVIGKMSDIKNIKLSDLKKWYDTWYQPNNATLVIVGDVNTDDALAQVKKYFAHIPKAKVPKRNTVTEPTFKGLQRFDYETSVPVPILYIGFNVPSLSTSIKNQRQDNEAYALALLSHVLDGGMSSRLETNLVRQQKILSQVSSGYDLLSRGDGLFFISAVPSAGVTLEQAEQAIQKEINNFKQHSISDTEILRAKTNYLTGLIFQQDNPSAQARMIGLIESIGLQHTILANLPNDLSQVSKQMLKNTAKKYFVDSNKTVMYVKPETSTTKESTFEKNHPINNAE